MNANYEALKEKHGHEEAVKRISEIRDIGGFGGNIPHDYYGGFDVQSVLDPTNTAVNDKAKDRIAELSGVSRKDADRRVESGEVSSAESLMDKTPKFPKAAV